MDNIRGAILMVLAMAGFALEDMFIKQVSAHLPTGQVMILLGVGGVLVYWVMMARQGLRLFSPVFFERGVILRNVMEFVGTGGYVLAFTLGALSSTSAILQAMPLVVTMGAALFLGQKVGWRRWTAILVGFVGVLIVIQPWKDGVSLISLLALVGVFGLSLRDVATRPLKGHIASLQLAAYGFLSVIPMGVLMLALDDRTVQMPTLDDAVRMTLCVLIGVTAYYMLIAASRLGDVAFVAPFRYARIVFALIIGATVFNEPLSPHMLTGSAIIILSGIYTFYRESRSRAASLS